jgi:hypothetical protein
MDERTAVQLELIQEIQSTLDDVVRWWLFGGWGLDARIGTVTRSHSDIEFWVARADADTTRVRIELSGNCTAGGRIGCCRRVRSTRRPVVSTSSSSPR